MAKFKYDDYDSYYDDYEIGGFIKNKHSKPKKPFKGKGHQKRKSEAEQWIDLMNQSEDFNVSENTSYSKNNQYTNNSDSNLNRSYIKKDSNQNNYNTSSSTNISKPQEPKKFVPGPNTHSIKGIDIDLDRVDNMEKIESAPKGFTTYGIKFYFTGNKGLYRVIWYNTNKILRDKTWDVEYPFWKGLGH